MLIYMKLHLSVMCDCNVCVHSCLYVCMSACVVATCILGSLVDNNKLKVETATAAIAKYVGKDRGMTSLSAHSYT